jgi:WD40 repeat protein
MKQSIGLNVVLLVATFALVACLPNLPTGVETKPTVTIAATNSSQPGTIKVSGGSARHVAWSPNGKLLAVASKGVSIIDAQTLAEVRSLSTPHEVLSVAYSPDGSVVAAGLSSDGVVRLWKTSDWSSLPGMEGHTSSALIYDLEFSPDGKILASAGNDNVICLSRVSDAKLLLTLSGHTGDVRDIAFSPDGQLIASASTDKTVRVWRVSDGTALLTLRLHTGEVHGVAFSPDGQTLASASIDNSVRLWRVSDGTLLRTIELPGAWYTVTFMPDGQTVAAGGSDNTIRAWRVSDGALMRTLTGHSNSLKQILLSPDGQTLASASADNTVRLWSTK